MKQFKLLEILISRLCHDLINPISVVKNGLEFLHHSDDPESTIEINTFINQAVQKSLNNLIFLRTVLGYNGLSVLKKFSDYQKSVAQLIYPHCVNFDYQSIENLFHDPQKLTALRASLLVILTLKDSLSFTKNGLISYTNQQVIDIHLYGEKLVLQSEIIDALSQMQLEQAITSQTVLCYIMHLYFKDHQMKLYLLSNTSQHIHLQLY